MSLAKRRLVPFQKRPTGVADLFPLFPLHSFLLSTSASVWVFVSLICHFFHLILFIRIVSILGGYSHVQDGMESWHGKKVHGVFGCRYHGKNKKVGWGDFGLEDLYFFFLFNLISFLLTSFVRASWCNPSALPGSVGKCSVDASSRWAAQKTRAVLRAVQLL